jgi:hypothetical protein
MMADWGFALQDTEYATQNIMETDMADNIIQINGNATAEVAKQRKPLRRKTKPQKGELKYGRAAVANGNGLLPNTDERMWFPKRYKQIVNTIVDQCGGIEQCSEVKLQNIRRFAAVSCLAEQIEARAATGEKISITEHASLSSATVRLSNRIGITWNAKDISITPPTPEAYFEFKRQQKEAADDE